mmetsp:Transcript_56439/g.103541  ORF Transcript_56439/g.103541 Transcript_56439/m.103541 type:complete len:176 (-) Transcript_56439:184-711(-)
MGAKPCCTSAMCSSDCRNCCGNNDTAEPMVVVDTRAVFEGENPEPAADPSVGLPLDVEVTAPLEQVEEAKEEVKEEVVEEPAPPPPPPPPPVTLEMRFLSDSGVKTFTFTKKPIGLAWSKRSPIVIEGVAEGSEAKQLGVEVRWQFHSIGGVSLHTIDSYPEALAIINKQIETLP